MKAAVLLVLSTASAAVAGPSFENRSDALPPHVYDGDWQHYVGGGVAVFDCNGDVHGDRTVFRFRDLCRGSVQVQQRSDCRSRAQQPERKQGLFLQ